MSDIIRRNKVVPVQARRAQPDPEVLQIPGAGPIPVPPQHPGVTQNIIYVNVPAGQPQAPPPAADPGEIHVHNHIHQYPKRRRGGRYGASFLGTLGFVLGGVACGTCYVPQLLPLARFIAIAGVGCAALGLLGSLLFRKNAAGMPLLGLIVAGFSYGLWMMKTGQLPKAVQDVVSQATAAAPTPPAETTPAPAAPNPPPVRVIPPGASNTPPQDRTRLHDSSIFGDGGHWGNGTPTLPQATPTTPATPTPPVVTPPVVPAAPVIDSATAAANLESARVIAARKMGVDYATAKTAADDAKKECDQTRATAAPQSPELKAAWETYLNAASKLTQVEKQLAADPAVAAAEQMLKAAKAAGK